MNIVENIEYKFLKLFGKKPLIVRSPGRVNLIGEHTDYNEGFVLPAAIDKAIIFAVAPRPDNLCKIHSEDLNADYEFDVTNFSKATHSWPNYLLGVVHQLKKNGYNFSGFECVFGGDIPIGAGLSSSAAIEAGLGFALSKMFDLNVPSIDIVKMAQLAEHEFAGVRCGIMDQFINIFGKKDKVLKLDCRSLDYEYFPFEMKDIKIVLFDTHVKHSLASGEYNIRRGQCEEGVKLIQKHDSSVKSLRDVPLQLLLEHKNEFEPTVFKRCHYVIKENERLLNGCEDLKKNDFDAFGKLMYQSHAGLRDEYEVSCKELDVLVDIVSGKSDVLGARMMGGGFGGCTINLVKQNSVENIVAEVKEEYKKKVQQEVKVYVTSIMGGTEVLK
ncbi:MAG: galactokinase [Ignavibacteriales bacterium]|nr:MAG: galactokinase [Ignavibacteriales bacterium]